LLVRESAARALGKLGDKRALEPLVAVLGDEYAYVRWTAAQALGELGDKRALEPLVTALRDEDEHMRWAAAQALTALGWQPVNDTQRALLHAQATQKSEPSVLRALQEQNPTLAVQRIKEGGDIYQRDEHGNCPLHYAAAFGYTDIIDELVRVGADIESRNFKGQTPLVYAMVYGQFHASKVLWNYQRERLDTSNSFSKLVIELCTIGVDRTFSPEEAASGFFQKDSPLQHHHHPRAREIGHEIFSMGGFSLMQKAAEAVTATLGGRAAHDLSACWHGVGTWLH
jgi:hypothetical protein